LFTRRDSGRRRCTRWRNRAQALPRIYTYIHIPIYMCVHVCVYTQIVVDAAKFGYSTATRIYIHTHIHIGIYIYMNIYTFIYLSISLYLFPPLSRSLALSLRLCGEIRVNNQVANGNAEPKRCHAGVKGNSEDIPFNQTGNPRKQR